MKNVKRVEVHGKVWTKDEITGLLLTSDEAVKKALLRIYAFQTGEEKLIQDIIEHNGVGFTGVDGRILTSMANAQ